MFGDEPDLRFVGADDVRYQQIVGAVVAALVGGIGAFVGPLIWKLN